MSEPSDDEDDAALIDLPPTDEELHAAEQLRAALERPDARAADALMDVVLRARAAVGHAPPLDVAVRTGAVEAAIFHPPARAAIASTRGTRTWSRAVPWLAAAAALLVAVSGAAIAARFAWASAHGHARVLPEDGYARASDALFGAGLLPEQRASERLDTIVASRTRGYFSVLAADLEAERHGEAK